MAWGSKTSLGSQTAINNTVEEFLPSAGGGVTLNPGETCHVQLGIDNESGSVTDAVRIRLYTTLDATSEDWDEVPFMAFTHLPTAVTERDYSFLVQGIYKFRIGILSAGATDVYTVGGDYRLNGVSL